VLRITINESDAAIAMTLEGRIAGPWVSELSQAWSQISPRLGERTVSVDLCNVTYADASGKQVLSNIYEQSNAKLVANNLWAQYIADQIRRSSNHQENGHGSNA
jgi:ABC-type transporter Mla MlaB component